MPEGRLARLAAILATLAVVVTALRLALDWRADAGLGGSPGVSWGFELVVLGTGLALLAGESRIVGGVGAALLGAFVVMAYPGTNGEEIEAGFHLCPPFTNPEECETPDVFELSLVGWPFALTLLAVLAAAAGFVRARR